MKTRITIFVIILGLFCGGFWFWYQDSLKPLVFGTIPPRSFTIVQGAGVRDIATRLEREGFIRSNVAFFLHVRLGGLGQKIQAGQYTISPSMDARTIATTLTRGSDDVRVTTLEGWRADEIAAKVAKELAIPEQEFLKHAKEGYMFPDTYMIPRTASAAAVAKIFTQTFEDKVTDQMRRDARDKGLSLPEVVTMASIVEREGNSDSDRPVIAGILLKRLRADWPLQADATIQYALGYQTDEKTWWKKNLTDEDKALDSPYNTYKHTGLPLGPISNPGLAAIKAVIYPVESDYWYYLHAPDGRVYYAKTLEEHDANIRRYLR